MKKWILAGAVTSLLLSLSAAKDLSTTFQGGIADSQCALNVHSLTRSHQEMLKSKNMGGTPAACASYCVKYLGGDYVLSTKSEVYRLDNQAAVQKFAGQNVRIRGTLDVKTNTIHLLTIEPVH